jgi:hypothetical protein
MAVSSRRAVDYFGYCCGKLEKGKIAPVNNTGSVNQYNETNKLTGLSDFIV